MNKHLSKAKNMTPNKWYWTSILVFVIAMIAISISVIYQYVSSSHWKESADDRISLANQSIDMLYDKSETSRANKVKFVNLYHKMIAKNGNLTKAATPENLKKLNYYYKHFNSKGSVTNYKKLHAEVCLKYSILEQFDNLFTDESRTTLDRTVTPTTIMKLNNSTFNDLTAMFVQNPNDAFVSRIIKQEKLLNKDIIVLDDVAKNFNEAYKFNVDDTKVTLSDGYHKDITSVYREGMSSLNYNWNSTGYLKKINNIMIPIVRWTLSKYDKYEDYMNDVQAKKTAYADWGAEQDAFFAKVKETHQAAVDAKHYQEQLEREQKEADKQSKADAEKARKKAKAAKTVPNFVGQSVSSATSWANSINANISISYEDTNNKSLNNKVKSTSPSASEKIYPGYDDDTLSIVVYRYVQDTSNDNQSDKNDNSSDVNSSQN